MSERDARPARGDEGPLCLLRLPRSPDYGKSSSSILRHSPHLTSTLLQLAAGISWFLTNSKDHRCVVTVYESLQWNHFVVLVIGMSVAIGAVFALASLLSALSPLLLYVVRISSTFFLSFLLTQTHALSLSLDRTQQVALGIVIGSLVSGFAAFRAFRHPCLPMHGLVPYDFHAFVRQHDALSAGDGKMIVVSALDALACLLLLAAAAALVRRGRKE